MLFFTYPQFNLCEQVFFFASPLHLTGSFHAPIRGGYQGKGRLSKMDCSDTTQSSPVVLGTRFKMLWLGLECRSKTQRTAFSHALTKEEPLEQLLFCLCKKRPRKKKDPFRCGKRFSDRASDFDPSPGAMTTRNCESDFCQLIFAHERSTKAGLCKTAPAKHTPAFL